MRESDQDDVVSYAPLCLRYKHLRCTQNTEDALLKRLELGNDGFEPSLGDMTLSSNNGSAWFGITLAQAPGLFRRRQLPLLVLKAKAKPDDTDLNTLDVFRPAADFHPSHKSPTD